MANPIKAKNKNFAKKLLTKGKLSDILYQESKAEVHFSPYGLKVSVRLILILTV